MNNSIDQNLAQSEYIVAAKGPRYSEMDQKTRLKELAARINEAFRFKGQQPSAIDTADMAVNLDRKLSQAFPEVTLPEIKLAFEYGVTGEYGDYFGLNFVTFAKFIKGYMENPERLDTIKAYRRATQKALPAPKLRPKTPEELRAQAKGYIADFRDQIRSSGSIASSLHSQEWLYDWLRANGHMDEPDTLDRNFAMDTAADWLGNYKKSSRRTFAETIDDARDAQEHTDDHRKTVRKAKAVLLTQFLMEHQSINI